MPSLLTLGGMQYVGNMRCTPLLYLRSCGRTTSIYAAFPALLCFCVL